MYDSKENLWNFLFFTGYLKQVSRKMENGIQYLTLSIPNQEAKYIYKNTITGWFRDEIKSKDLSSMYMAMQEGDAAILQIVDKGYDLWLPEEGYTEVLHYGIAFFRKQCRVKVGRRKF